MDQVEKEMFGAILEEQAAYEMARVGKLDIDNIEIWVWPKEGGYEPHFHFWNTDRSINGCIKLETNSYFPHSGYRSTLNTKQRKKLVEFLKSQSLNFPGLTNWNVVIGMWNSSNSQKPVDLDFPMPDYVSMSSRTARAKTTAGADEGLMSDQVDDELLEAIYKDRESEPRKEEDTYYCGAFWVCGESVKDIKHGHFSIRGAKIPCKFTGESFKDQGSEEFLTHQKLWPQYNKDFEDRPYSYFPRGLVSICNGTAFIHLPGLFNQPDIIDALVWEYKLKKLDLEIETTDVYVGDDYPFLLQ